ncbi:hypothetical protein ACG873_17115 [Mesorhizobium sp. AaZ16]|uniref:hypothetical protein n=1 Tax=Mesorhizobium sp. AaZ16 TaxID=3402289 RepID=UPI00374E4438
MDGWFIPGTPDPWIVLMTGGKRTVEVRDGKRWRKAKSGPGQIGVTSPGTTTEICWRSESSAPVETIHLHIDSGFFRRVAAECGRGNPDAIEITNALSESDPLIERLLGAVVPQLRGPDPSGHMFADAAEMIAIHLLQRYSNRVHLAPCAGFDGSRSRAVVLKREHLGNGVLFFLFYYEDAKEPAASPVPPAQREPARRKPWSLPVQQYLLIYRSFF